MLIREEMTKDVITVNPKQSLEEVQALLGEKKIHTLPVVEQDKLIGVVTKNDVARVLNRPGTYPETPVEWIMSKDLITISPDEHIAIAASIIRNNKINSLPVVEDEKIIGIITGTDILRVFIDFFGVSDDDSENSWN